MTIIPEELQIHEPDEKLLDIINSKIFNDRVLYEKQSVFHSVKVVENDYTLSFPIFTINVVASIYDDNILKYDPEYFQYL